ncbi:MAG: putative toxin-antitoxin system toxin component, PIN family [Terriglobia bacterium]
MVRAWINGAFELVESPQLIAELHRVLLREKFRLYVSEQEVEAYVAFLRRFATECPDPESRLRLTPDPGDDYLLALAKSQSADVLIAGDPHLYRMRAAEPPILTPRAFLSRLS